MSYDDWIVVEAGCPAGHGHTQVSAQRNRDYLRVSGSELPAIRLYLFCLTLYSAATRPINIFLPRIYSEPDKF